MKLKKAVSCAAAAAFASAAIAVLNVPVSAADSVSCKLYTQNTNSWTLYESDSFEITSDGGDYTVSVDAGGETDYITLYVKDVDAATAPDSFADGTLTVNSITVNGKSLTLDKTEYDLIGNGGVLDVCFINGWADTFVSSGEATMDEDGDSYVFGEEVNSFEVSFSVSFGGSDAASAEDTANDAEQASESEAEEAPASDNTTTSATTGNATAAAIAVVMAGAGAVAVASRKKM